MAGSKNSPPTVLQVGRGIGGLAARQVFLQGLAIRQVRNQVAGARELSGSVQLGPAVSPPLPGEGGGRNPAALRGASASE